MDLARKRRPDAALNGNGGVAGSKRFKQDLFAPHDMSFVEPCSSELVGKVSPEELGTVTGVISARLESPVTQCTAGCPFGEGCHFLHYVPGGINAVAHMTSHGNPALPPSSRNHVVSPAIPDGTSPPFVKTRMCNKYNSAEGCKFGDKCHFAHGERELGKPIIPSHEDRPPASMTGRLAGRIEPPPPGLAAAASFGASATAKISVDASLAGAIIGKAGVNSKQICRVTGAKLSIREHETDPNLRNIELEGTFDQIKQASTMVRELIVNISSNAAAPMKTNPAAAPTGPTSNYKTKLCENFAKGSCTFGERCHFAHGASDMRKPGA